MRSIRIAVLPVVLLLTLAISPAWSNAAKKPITQQFNFSDQVALTTDPSLTLTKPFCTEPAAARKKVKFSAALKHAASLVKKDHDSKAARKLARNKKATGNASRANSTAAGAIVSQKPDAAITVLLAAVRKSPKDPAPLEGLAVLLTQRGQAADALALLAKAGKLKGSKSRPYSVSAKAAQLNNTGFALLAQHQWAKATKSLSKAVKIAPELNEAYRNLGIAANCQNKQDKAMMFFAAGSRRQQWKGDIVTGSDGTTQVDPTKIFDVGHGVAPTLPSFTFPATSSALRASYGQIHSRSEFERGLTSAASDRFISAFRKVATSSEPLAYQGLKNVLNGEKLVDTFPSVAPLYATYKAADSAATIAMIAMGDQGGFHCDQTPAASAAISAEWAAARPYLIERYRMQSALAANLKNPDAHAAAMAYAEMGLRSDVWNGVFSQLDNTAFVASVSCPVPADPPTEAAAGDLAAPSSEACPDSIKALTFKVSFQFMTISARCQEIKLTMQTVGPIGVFGQVGFDGAKGTVTIFAGPRAGHTISLVNGGPKIGADLRDGLYIKVGKSGVQDVGMRVEMKAGASWGGVSTGHGDSMNISFIGAF